ncbi:MAG TPA: 50S ribosomal protein L29 [Candidatus Woesearchaeota archaeon]|nr:50S ribosomal protein L29 [Candidatus Woesearchaeota archaeon]
MTKQAKELKKLGLEELSLKLTDARLDLMKLVAQAKSAASQKDISKIKNLKAHIARLKTLVKEKQMEESN